MVLLLSIRSDSYLSGAVLIYDIFKEQVELEELVRQARIDNANRMILSDSSRMVILMVKRPLLALRFQLSENQVEAFIFISCRTLKDARKGQPYAVTL